MVTTTTAPSPAAVRAAVGDVPDPELPALTIAMLGMVHDITIEDGDIVVELLPTFSGCPATDVIADDVRAAVTQVEAVGEVAVRFRLDPPWTPDRISQEGHEALREFGIAPPLSSSERPAPVDWSDAHTRPASRLPPLPVLTTTGSATSGLATSGLAAGPAPARPCPYCDSTDTERDGLFGPTPCRDLRYCNACRQPFEAFKS